MSAIDPACAPLATPHPTQEQDHAARRWVKTFAVGVLVVVAFLLWTLFTPPYQGDLTRLGRLSETAFGPQHAETLVDPALRHSVALNEADVLVIGDSFSEPLLWQSVLVAQGLKVATVHWRVLGPLCADLSAVLRAQGFHGHWVIAEVVERQLEQNLHDAQDCAHARQDRLLTQHHAKDWASAGPWGLNTHETLATGILTYWNTRQVAQQPRAPELINTLGGAELVRIQQVPDGCQVFSHRLCERGLFLVDDRERSVMSAKQLPALKALAQRHADMALTWLVMPNKTTVYLEPERAAHVGQPLAAQGLGPDLFGLLQAQRLEVKDLYRPNDTHTGHTAQRLIGASVWQWYQTRVLPTLTLPPLKAPAASNAAPHPPGP